jgi:septum formation inhibitor-activating ATPase MinD
MQDIEIAQKICQNMTSAELPIKDLRIKSNPFIGWQIDVISDGFLGKSFQERKQLVTAGLEQVKIEVVDLLTPEEQEAMGAISTDSNSQRLPLWYDALFKGHAITENALFPSDLEQDLKPPIITTFYSLKGGVGKSTALAYTAKILARRGLTVLCVDMDLKAPTLCALFGKEDDVKEHQGLLSVLLSLEKGDKPSIQEHIIRLSDTEEIYCLPGGIINANYALQLGAINPSSWYSQEDNKLRKLIELLKEDLSFNPDVILLDAPSGINSVSGPLLFDLADLDIITFFPHPQTKIGSKSVVQALLAAHTNRKIKELDFLTPEPRFLVSPIPESKAADIIARYQHRAIAWITDWLAPVNQQRPENEQLSETEITHFISYKEAIAITDKILDDQKVWQDFAPVADWIEMCFSTKTEQQLQGIGLQEYKQKVLSQLRFDTQVAEYQDNILATFVKTDLISKALQTKNILVIGYKGAGKTTIFRRINEGKEYKSIVISSVAPLKIKLDYFWVLSAYGYEKIAEFLTENNLKWRDFWLTYMAVVCHINSGEKVAISEPAIAVCFKEKITTELQMVYCIKKLLAIPKMSILAKDWLMKIDQLVDQETLLLFDGLGHGFGSTKAQEIRRDQAITDLLNLSIELVDSLQKLKAKIFLREDIWQKLNFPNKNYFFGRSVTLKWEQAEDLCKIVIKQALQSPSFCRLITTRLQNEDQKYWLEYKLKEIWCLLVGERMKGGASAYTIDWVHKYLADGNNHRSPRNLLHLFATALEWEKQKQPYQMYWKTIMRSRSFVASLMIVSQQALDTLVNEYLQLDHVVEQLRFLGETPCEARELSKFVSVEDLQLAKQVGLLLIYEGTETDIKKYKVPELYRLAIGMKNKG